MAKRVFFSFHYNDVADFRVNVVRNHDLTKDGIEDAGYIDASLWEEAERKGSDNLKRLIDGKLKGTSVTAVLVGSETWSRRWVRYEILKSVFNGSRIFGLHLNGIPNKDRQTAVQGNNPFDFLAYTFSADGTKLSLSEWDNTQKQWVNYADLDGWSLGQIAPPGSRGKFVRLCDVYPIYDWAKDDGYNKFSTWVG